MSMNELDAITEDLKRLSARLDEIIQEMQGNLSDSGYDCK